MSRLILAALVLFAGAQPSAPDLEARIQKLIDSSGAEVAVAVRSLDGRTHITINHRSRDQYARV